MDDKHHMNRHKRYWEGQHTEWKEKEAEVEHIEPELKQNLMNMFRKFKRTGAAFLHRFEERALEDFLGNARSYLLDYDLMFLTRQLYRQVKQKEEEQELKVYLDL